MSKNGIVDIQKSSWNLDILKMELWIAKNLAEFWISLIWFLDIHNSINVWMSISQVDFRISIIRLVSDIQLELCPKYMNTPASCFSKQLAYI